MDESDASPKRASSQRARSSNRRSVENVSMWFKSDGAKRRQKRVPLSNYCYCSWAIFVSFIMFSRVCEAAVVTTIQSNAASQPPVLPSPQWKYKRLEATIRRIVSRLTSQEMEEKNWLENHALYAPMRAGTRFEVGSDLHDSLSDDDSSIPHPRIVTIPMSAVPPRLQVPGSTRGMPASVRLINLDSDQSRARWFKVFRRLILSTSTLVPKTQAVDLHGGIVGVGEYYSIIELGNKRIRVQIDTGSSTLAVPMTGCSSCIRKANRYSIEEAVHAKPVPCSSYQCASERCTVSCPFCSANGACCSPERPNECGFSLRYADGSSASGTLVTDEVTWGDLKANVTFGGILNNSPNFERPEVDGILGMAYRSLACNPSCFDPPFDAMVKAGLVRDVFSICMTATGGKLILGGYNPVVAKTPVRYVPLYLSDPARYYRVRLNGSLQVGDKHVHMPNFKTAIVDTGTTLIVMSTKTFSRLREHFQQEYCEVPELCGEDSWFQSGMCVSLSEQDLQKLPTLTFNLEGGLDLKLAPTDYMLEYRRGPKVYKCVGIMGMDGLGGMVVLGNTLMQKYVTVYDREYSRVGFAEAAPNCDSRTRS